MLEAVSVPILVVHRARSNTISAFKLLPVLEMLMRLLAVTRNAPSIHSSFPHYGMHTHKIVNKKIITVGIGVVISMCSDDSLALSSTLCVWRSGVFPDRAFCSPENLMTSTHVV